MMDNEEQINREELRVKAKTLAFKYFDGYCATGYYYAMTDFLEIIKKQTGINDMGYIMVGIMEGIAEAESQSDHLDYLRSPIAEINKINKHEEL